MGASSAVFLLSEVIRDENAALKVQVESLSAVSAPLVFIVVNDFVLCCVCNASTCEK